jgi:hypothetical protein
MAENSGSGFSGFLAGIVLIAILIVGGYFLYTNGGLGRAHTAQINVNVPTPTHAAGGG